MQHEPNETNSLPERELSHAGSVIDKAIEYMTSQDISELAIASALLGGALGLLTKVLPDAVVVQILQNAVASVENGEIHRARDTDTAPKA
jgi:hypothetical protein